MLYTSLIIKQLAQHPLGCSSTSLRQHQSLHHSSLLSLSPLSLTPLASAHSIILIPELLPSSRAHGGFTPFSPLSLLCSTLLHHASLSFPLSLFILLYSLLILHPFIHHFLFFTPLLLFSFFDPSSIPFLHSLLYTFINIFFFSLSLVILVSFV